MMFDWYCEKLSCKMFKAACDKRYAIANSPVPWTQIDRFLTCLKCDQEKSGRRIEDVKETPSEKTCTKCGKTKPIDEYNINKGCRDGHENSCKECKYALAKANQIQKTKPAIDPEERAQTIKVIQREAESYADTLRSEREEKLNAALKQSSKPFTSIRRKAIYVDPPLVTGDIIGMTIADMILPIPMGSGVVISEKRIDEPQAPLPVTEDPQRGPKEKDGKPDWSIMPFNEMEYALRVFEYGVKKYGGPFTYRAGIPISELLSAAMRHLIAIQNGEEIDPESGQPHAAHVVTNGLMMISQFIKEEKCPKS
jgi:hypothetical protein